MFSVCHFCPYHWVLSVILFHQGFLSKSKLESRLKGCLFEAMLQCGEILCSQISPCICTPWNTQSSSSNRAIWLMRAIHNPIQPLAICNHSLFQIDRCPSQWITRLLQCLSTFTNTNLSDHRPLSPSPKSQPSNTTVIKIFTIDHTNTTIFFNHLNLPLTDVYIYIHTIWILYYQWQPISFNVARFLFLSETK